MKKWPLPIGPSSFLPPLSSPSLSHHLPLSLAFFINVTRPVGAMKSELVKPKCCCFFFSSERVFCHIGVSAVIVGVIVMFLGNREWKFVTETDLRLTQPCASAISQLSQIWWRFCPSVNRRIACTRFLNEQNSSQELLDQIAANLSPVPADFAVNLWRSPSIMQLIPKSHFHSSFSDRCFEVAEFGRDAQNEVAVIFRSAKLSSFLSTDDDDQEMMLDECESEKRFQNPHISSTYAFHLVKKTTAPNLTTTDEDDDGNALKTNASLKLWCHFDTPSAQVDFLLKWLWPRLQKWAYKICATSPRQEIVAADQQDNRLLSDQKSYTDRYWCLKLTFGPNQQTDAKKRGTVNYECCAVAAYLLELWKIDGIGPRRGFVDLECGKGSLTHLLQMEGLPGVGIHHRERPEWAAFKCHGTRLIQLPAVRDISMADLIQNVVHGETDFLIGNRCSQMIPWIPLIAAKLRCNFFLLPNIPTNFHSNFGKRMVPKYEQSPSGRLEQFYAFLEQISRMLGFDVTTDQLKIPSRRRKCLMGVVPPNGLPKSDELDKIICQLLSLDGTVVKQTKHQPTKHLNANFTSRNDCFIDFSRRIVAYLVSKDPDRKLGNWRCGGSATVEEIAKNILNDEHRLLLSGIRRGLPSFLKSQRQLFVLSNGIVSLRCWPLDYHKFEQEIGGGKTRNFPCLSQQHHPDGCPIEPEICPCKHN